MMKKLITLLFFIYGTASAQSLSVFDADASNFPILKANFFAFDATGNQITNLSPADFEVKEGNISRNVISVSCPTIKPPEPLSSVLVIDESSSMTGGNLDLAIEAARAWLYGLPLGKSECAITAFHNKNYFIQDFSTDRTLLLQRLITLSPNGGTNYDAALLNPEAGGLLVTRKARFKRVIVFLSDGQPNYPPNISQIITEATMQNARIYTVILNMKCPQYMKDISTQTGGLWFENINSAEQARVAYQKILQDAQGGVPCKIEWESGIHCTSTLIDVDVQLKKYEAFSELNYLSPDNSIARLEFYPSSLKFLKAINDTCATITVTARNANFNITNIITSNQLYWVRSQTKFSLLDGESKIITICYTPIDSGYTFAKFSLENDLCPTNYYVTGGFPGKKAILRTLKLIHPNGGEVFVAGSDTIITWEGVAPNEPVTLEYRTNDNEKWKKITDTATGFSYRFRIPKIASDKYLARVSAKAQEFSGCYNGNVQIGNQIWMGCNLDVVTYRNGDTIPEIADPAEWANQTSGAWCYYNNDPENGIIYGKLYNWFAVNDQRGLAPEGWHIPSDNEWKELEINLGGASVAGGKLKETGINNWKIPNTSATNETGFFGLPGGWRYGLGNFNDLGIYGFWWSSTEVPKFSAACSRKLSFDSNTLQRHELFIGRGHSVRCVKD